MQQKVNELAEFAHQHGYRRYQFLRLMEAAPDLILWDVAHSQTEGRRDHVTFVGAVQ